MDWFPDDVFHLDAGRTTPAEHVAWLCRVSGELAFDGDGGLCAAGVLPARLPAPN